MRSPIRSLAPLTLLGLALTAPPAAIACSCWADYGADQPCEEYWIYQEDAIFVGRAVSVAGIPGARDDYPGPKRRFRFEVVEAFVGVEGPTVDVLTGNGGGDCGIDFRIGASYFLYAGRNERGELSAWLCGPTKRLAEASRDVAYARLVARGGYRTALYGRVFRTDRERFEDITTTEPLAGVVVTVAGRGGQRYLARTDAEGEFEVEGRLEGAYTVRALLPEDLAPAEPQQVEVPAGQCTGVEIKAGRLATLRGRAFEADGKPAVYLRFRILRADVPRSRDESSSQSAQTDEDGRFVVDELPAGDYLVGINPDGTIGDQDSPYAATWYPGTNDPAKAVRITLRRGEVRAIDFQLPPKLEKRAVTGVVRWPDGRPAPGASVFLRGQAPGSWSERTETDEAGRFRIEGFEGQLSELSTWFDGSRRIEGDKLEIVIGDSDQGPPIEYELRLYP